jgi:hypothetical protein
MVRLYVEGGGDSKTLRIECRKGFSEFLDQGFNPGALPAEARPIETIPKDEVVETLRKASMNCKTKASYGKGAHSFKLLALIDPTKVTAASPWAQRFIGQISRLMGC